MVGRVLELQQQVFKNKPQDEENNGVVLDEKTTLMPTRTIISPKIAAGGMLLGAALGGLIVHLLKKQS